MLLFALLLAAALPDPSPPWTCGKRLPKKDFVFQDREGSGDAWTSLESPRGLRVHRHSKHEAADPDLLGRELPPFVTRERALAWTEHPRPETVNLVTARRWEGDRWVVLVAGKAPGTPPPDEEISDVRLAVVEMAGGADGPVRRVARTVGPHEPRPDWGTLPKDLEPSLDDESPDVWHADLAALDFAPYRLARGERAFGLRTTTIENYAAGLAHHEILSLFRIDGETLVPILDVPIGVVKILAGEPENEERMRQFHTIEIDLLLGVRPRTGKADLVLRARGGRGALVFRWNAAKGVYGCGR